jgi:Glycosyltransferase
MVGPSLTAHGGIAAVASALVKGVPAASPSTQVMYLPLAVGRSRGFLAKASTALAAYVRFASLAPNSVDVVHVHVTYGSDFWRAAPLVVTAKARHVKVVLHVHPPRAFSGFVRRGPRPLSFLKRYIVGLANTLVATCPSGRDDLSELLPNSHVEVLENMVDLSAYASSPLAQRQPRAVFLGWLVPEKGVYDLLEAFAKVYAVVDHSRLVMYGPYCREVVLSAVDHLGLGEVVTVGEWIAGRGKVDLLSSSRVLVLPSYTEGMPVVIAECMASGLPIVVTPVGGIPDVVEDGGNGYLVPPGDVSQLARAMETLLTDDDVWQRMSDECLRQAPRFDAVAACRRMAEIYRDLAEGH